MRDLNLRHLSGLAATVHCGSLSAAARHLNVSQPALTQGIARLETQLGTQLLDRHPVGATPTVAALTLAPRIERALCHIGSRRVTMAQLHVFIAVARNGSYRGAAAQMGFAEPSIHRATNDLAIALGRPLVERRGKGIALTTAGRRIARGFGLALAELNAALDELAVIKGREIGRIAIGAMPLSRARLLPAAITSFHAAHPDFDIRIVEGSHAELAEPLRDGEIDVTIGALRGHSTGPDLVETPLFEDKPMIVARRGHPLGDSNPDAKALARYPWIMSAPGTPLRALWEAIFGETIPHVPVECGSVITIREILRASDFLTLLSPDQVAAEQAAGWLTLITPPQPEPVRTIGLTTRADWQPTALQAAFIDQLAIVSERQN